MDATGIMEGRGGGGEGGGRDATGRKVEVGG